MLPTYQPNTDVSVSVDFPVAGDPQPRPSVITYSVLDETGAVVSNSAGLAVPDSGSAVNVTVDKAMNAIPDDAIRTMRVVRAVFTYADGDRTVDARYVIERLEKLVLMKNSFQTIEQALLTRLELPQLDGWDGVSESEQIAAMASAFEDMCGVQYRYRLSQDKIDFNSRLLNHPQYYHISAIRFFTPEDFNADFPQDFQHALRRAQVIQADNILAGDPVGDKRADGIISETTGEAKMFFNNKPPLRTPLCRDAMAVLSPFLYRNNRLRRS